MNLTRLLPLVLSAVLSALTFSSFAQSPQRWDISFDPQDWKPVAENREGRLTERIYVAPGESEYFWNEKLTIGHQRLAFSTDDYMTGFLEFIDENCRPYKMTPIEQTKESVFVQWDGDCRVTGQQTEFRRVIVAEDGVHVIAFAAKKSRLSESKRAAWMKIIGEAKLRKP